MSKSLLSETWIPAFPFYINGKKVVSIFRNQPEIFPLYILYSSDLKRYANNDGKYGKGKQTNNSEWNLKQRKQAPHLGHWSSTSRYRHFLSEGTYVQVNRNKACDALIIFHTKTDLRVETAKQFNQIFRTIFQEKALTMILFSLPGSYFPEISMLCYRKK